MGKNSKKKHPRRPAVATAVKDTPAKLAKKDYERELFKLQVELVKMQSWVKETGARIVIIFEGRDAAGKGGVIKRILERVSPRVFRLVALPAPTDRENPLTLERLKRRVEALQRVDARGACRFDPRTAQSRVQQTCGDLDLGQLRHPLSS